MDTEKTPDILEQIEIAEDIKTEDIKTDEAILAAEAVTSPDVIETGSKLPDDHGPKGLGGWLVLLAISLFATPVMIIFTTLTTHLPLLTSGSLELLSKPVTQLYSPLWKPMIYFEISANTVTLALSVTLLVLFFSRKKTFPKALILLMALSLVVTIVDETFLLKIGQAVKRDLQGNSFYALLRPIARALVWIPYMLKSVRVKNTFTR